MILKSIRVPESVARKIQEWAKKAGISQGELLKKMANICELYQMQQQYERDVMRMSKDKAYLKEQVDLANSNFI